MSSDEHERTASLMTPARLAQMKPRAAASPAAWLDQMAADAGAMHVRRLMELREQLEAQALGRDDSQCAASLRAASAMLERIDFSLLQQNKGLFARVTGKGKSAGLEFVHQFDQVQEAAERVRKETQALAQRDQAAHSVLERGVVEFEVEYRGLEKIIDQGARWLQDMRGQLQTRQAAAEGDAAALAKVKEDAARCELLVTRLKQLRAASSAAQQAHQLLQEAGARRVALVQTLQQRVAVDFKVWQTKMAPLASAAGDNASPALHLDGPKDAQRELKQHLEEAAAECDQLATQETALAQGLAELDGLLHAAIT